MMIFVSQIDQRHFELNEDTFKAIDKDSSGLISIEELQQAFKDQNNPEELYKILQSVDYDKNGEINYSEFLASTVGNEHLNRANLEQLFKFLDVGMQRYLSAQGLEKVFKRAGKAFTLEETTEMMEEAGLSAERVEFDEFLQLMQRTAE